MTPSLIPRPAIFQGVLAGLVTAIVYLMAYTGLTIWRHLHLPIAKGKLAQRLHLALAVPVLLYLVFCLFRAVPWQNSIRERMGMEPLESAQTLLIFFLAALVFLVCYYIGEAVQRLYDILRARLYKVMPRRTANVLGLILAALIVIVFTRDWVGRYLMERLDRNYAMAQNLFDASGPVPDHMADFFDRSQLSWEKMGAKGRDFISRGPTQSQIEAFTGQTAKSPIRIYVGLTEAESPQVRANLALTELIRTGAFRRKVLIVTMPTGTGWLDPANHDAVEILHGGDVATIAVQYSYLQSPLAMMTEPQSGLEQSQALLDTIYNYWSELPEDSRPRLYLTGISLGAWSSMYSFDIFKLVSDPIDGAIWAGPPFPSNLWNQTNAKRNLGSPYVVPTINSGETVRYVSQYKTIDDAEQDWGDLRLVFLQYASDPIVFYEPGSLFRKPQWMREPLADDVSPYLRFLPIVTHFQLAVDMLVANSTPMGFGHNYASEHYIDAWISVSDPERWSEPMTARLKQVCDTDFKVGCVIDPKTGTLAQSH